MRNFDRVFFSSQNIVGFGKMAKIHHKNKITGRHVDWALLVISSP
jgi:hypothetical protein